MGTPLTAMRSFATVNDRARHYQHGIQIEIVRSTSAPLGEVKRSIRVSTVGTVIDNTKVCGAPSPFSGGIGNLSSTTGTGDDGQIRLLESFLCAMEIVDEEADVWAVRDFSPQTLNKQTAVTTSTSFDVNLGFFAGTPTGGVSWGSSSSKGWNLTDYDLRASAGRPASDQAATSGPVGSWEISKDPSVVAPEISFGSLQPKLEIIFEATSRPTNRYTRIATVATTNYTITTRTEGTAGKLLDKLPSSGFWGWSRTAFRKVANFVVPKTSEEYLDMITHVNPDPDFENVVYGQTYEIDWETGEISIVSDGTSDNFQVLRLMTEDLAQLIVPRVPNKAPKSELHYDVEQTLDRVSMGYWPGSDLLVGFSLDANASNSVKTRRTELALPDPVAEIESLWRMEVGSGFEPETSAVAWPFRSALAVDSAQGPAIWASEPGVRRRDHLILVEEQAREPFLWLPEAPQGIVGDLEGEMSIVWRDHLLTLKTLRLDTVRRFECLSRVVAATRVSAGWLALSGGRLYRSTDCFERHRDDISTKKLEDGKTTFQDVMQKVYDPSQPCALIADGDRVYLISGRRFLSFNVDKDGSVSDTQTSDRFLARNVSPHIQFSLSIPVYEGMPVGYVEANINKAHVIVVQAAQ